MKSINLIHLAASPNFKSELASLLHISAYTPRLREPHASYHQLPLFFLTFASLFFSLYSFTMQSVPSSIIVCLPQQQPPLFSFWVCDF